MSFLPYKTNKQNYKINPTNPSSLTLEAKPKPGFISYELMDTPQCVRRRNPAPASVWQWTPRLPKAGPFASFHAPVEDTC